MMDAKGNKKNLPDGQIGFFNHENVIIPLVLFQILH